MKLLSYTLAGRPAFGAMTAAGIRDLSARYAGRCATLRDLLALGRPLPSVEEIERLPLVADSDVHYLPVMPEGGAIFCVGLNYAAHARESGRALPKHPSTFLKLGRSLVGHDTPLRRPKVSAMLDWEAELAVVIGRRARHVDEAHALACVAGYTCLNDVTVRDWQHERDVTQGKNFLASGACGPWMVTADEIADPATLTVMSRVNGVPMQRASTSDLIFSVPRLVAYFSILTELRPGDMISTGTPAGVGHRREPPVFLRPGDVVEVEVSGVGILRNTVVDE